MRFLLSIFTWWNNCTIGTAFFTWRHGHFVGQDQLGNKYYTNVAANASVNTSASNHRSTAAVKRWVLYNGEIEASRIAPDWHAWLHYLTILPPSEKPLPKNSWQLPHQANMTGTKQAYHPRRQSSDNNPSNLTLKHYEPWQPD